MSRYCIHIIITLALLAAAPVFSCCKRGRPPAPDAGAVAADSIAVTASDTLVTEEVPPRGKTIVANPYRSYVFRGTIEWRRPFLMDILIDPEGFVSGKYKFDGEREYTHLRGLLTGSRLQIEEIYRDGDRDDSGYFDGQLDALSGKVAGIWTPADRSETLPFEMANYRDVTNPAHEFELQVEEEPMDGSLTYREIERITVRDPAGGIVQVIDSLEIGWFDYDIFLEDINFDGYRDLVICLSGRSQSPIRKTFLYDPLTGKYAPRNILPRVEGLYGDRLYFDYEQSTVKLDWKLGSAYGNAVFGYSDGRYDLISFERVDEDRPHDTGPAMLVTTTSYRSVHGSSVEEEKRERLITRDGRETTRVYRRENGQWVER